MEPENDYDDNATMFYVFVILIGIATTILLIQTHALEF